MKNRDKAGAIHRFLCTFNVSLLIRLVHGMCCRPPPEGAKVIDQTRGILTYVVRMRKL